MGTTIQEGEELERCTMSHEHSTAVPWMTRGCLQSYTEQDSKAHLCSLLLTVVQAALRGRPGSLLDSQAAQRKSTCHTLCAEHSYSVARILTTFCNVRSIILTSLIKKQTNQGSWRLEPVLRPKASV